MIPKVKECIELKKPTHFVSPQRMLELERINSLEQRQFVLNRKAYLNFNPNIQTGEFNKKVLGSLPKRTTEYHRPAYVCFILKF